LPRQNRAGVLLQYPRVAYIDHKNSINSVTREALLDFGIRVYAGGGKQQEGIFGDQTPFLSFVANAALNARNQWAGSSDVCNDPADRLGGELSISISLHRRSYAA
jgi:hypothetical protein